MIYYVYVNIYSTNDLHVMVITDCSHFFENFFHDSMSEVAYQGHAFVAVQEDGGSLGTQIGPNTFLFLGA